MKNKKEILNLLDQIIENEKAIDEKHRRKSLSKMDYAEATGESFAFHHLKELKKLINEND